MSEQHPEQPHGTYEVVAYIDHVLETPAIADTDVIIPWVGIAAILANIRRGLLENPEWSQIVESNLRTELDEKTARIHYLETRLSQHLRMEAMRAENIATSHRAAS